MLFQKQKIKGLIVIKPESFVDKRGLFRRSYCLNELKLKKINFTIKQVNISENKNIQTLRGFHYQKYPFSEDKIIDNLLMSININKNNTISPPIDPYIYILKYYMDNNKPEKALPYIDVLFKLDIKNQESNKNLNPYFYDYTRWNLISVICLMCNQKLDKGYQALNKIIHYGRPNDIQNMKMYKTIMN